MKLSRLLILASVILVAGCGSTLKQTSTVDPTFVAWAAENNQDPESLARGQNLYFTACTRCHGPMKITKYTTQDWAYILPRMADQARLVASETADIEAYLKAVLAHQTKTAPVPLPE